MAPRGGRGGARGRGGTTKPGFMRIGGMEIAYDTNIASGEKEGRPRPSETFPTYPSGGGRPPAPRPPTDLELREIQLWREVRAQIRAGPLWTTLRSDGVAGGQGSSKSYRGRFGPGAATGRLRGGSTSGARAPSSSTAAANVDAFYALAPYSARYHTRRLKLPRLDQQAVRLDPAMFPRELHDLIGVAAPAKAKGAGAGKAKRLKTERDSLDANELEAAEADEADEDNKEGEEEDDEVKPRDRKRKKVGPEEGEDVDDDEPMENQDDADDLDEEEQDSDFEDNEEGGDYDAEGYFDDGGDDAGDDDMGDGDGGGDYD